MATTTYGTPYVSGTDLVANWPAASLTVANSIDAAGYYIGRGINAQTASVTGVLTDAGKTVTMTNAGATTFTVPANASVAYPTGTRINILNLGAGACTPTAGAGVTINGTITALATNQFAQLIKTATNTWSYIPAGGGKILQVVRATDTTARSTTSTSFVDVTGMTVTITPQAATSAILIICVGRINTSGSSNANNLGVLQITDSSNTAISGAQSVSIGLYQVTHSSGQLFEAFNLVAYATPGTTSPVTYKMRFKADAGGITVNIDNSAATGQMYAIEVAA